MNSTNRKRTLLVSGAVILLCMSIIVGTTWALFTDTQKVTNHLKAGDLTATLTRIALTKKTLDDDGYLVETEVQKTTDAAVDFTNPTTKNVFDIGTDEKIVPGSKFVATMQIENNSDVAFGYWIEVVCTDKTNGEVLAKQLKISVDANEKYFADGDLRVGSKDAFVGVIEKGDNATFTVTVEFEDKGFEFNETTRELSSVNNDAAGQNLTFDLVVYAIQEPSK